MSDLAFHAPGLLCKRRCAGAVLSNSNLWCYLDTGCLNTVNPGPVYLQVLKTCQNVGKVCWPKWWEATTLNPKLWHFKKRSVVKVCAKHQCEEPHNPKPWKTLSVTLDFDTFNKASECNKAMAIDQRMFCAEHCALLLLLAAWKWHDLVPAQLWARLGFSHSCTARPAALSQGVCMYVCVCLRLCVFMHVSVCVCVCLLLHMRFDAAGESKLSRPSDISSWSHPDAPPPVKWNWEPNAHTRLLLRHGQLLRWSSQDHQKHQQVYNFENSSMTSLDLQHEQSVLHSSMTSLHLHLPLQHGHHLVVKQTRLRNGMRGV